MRLILGLLAFLFSAPAMAQTVAYIAPFPLRGQGNLVITPSTSISIISGALTRPPNSPLFPDGASTGTVTITNWPTSANAVFVCWQGGVCSATVGEPLAIGAGRTVNLFGQNMTTQPVTVFTVAATITVEW